MPFTVTLECPESVDFEWQAVSLKTHPPRRVIVARGRP
jgi:hypothetical protein